MPDLRAAARAYQAASNNRTERQQEADVFRLVNARLQSAREAGAIARVRALADNRRLWMAVSDLARDPANALPDETRLGIVSLGLSVQRAMDSGDPDFDFLIAVNHDIAAGLAGDP